MEILVPVVCDEAIEPLDGGFERRRITLELLCEPLKRIGLLQVSRVEPLLRFLAARHRASQHVLAHELAIKYSPTRYSRHRFIPREHSLAIRHVGAALVHITRAALVDEDHM